jgi:uncharacterized protein
MDINELKSSHRDFILQTAAESGLTNLRVFGSFAQGEGTKAHDIDFLYDIQKPQGIFAIMRAKTALEDRLGMPVDLVYSGSLSPHIRDRVFREAVPL